MCSPEKRMTQSIIRPINVGLQGKMHAETFIGDERSVGQLAQFLSSDVTALDALNKASLLWNWVAENHRFPLLNCSVAGCQWE